MDRIESLENLHSQFAGGFLPRLHGLNTIVKISEIKTFPDEVVEFLVFEQFFQVDDVGVFEGEKHLEFFEEVVEKGGVFE